MELKRLFSKGDLISLTEIIHKSLSCTEENELRSLFSSLKQLIHFEYAVCGMGSMAADGEVREFDMINVNYPSEWISCCIARQFYRADPVIKENFVGFDVQYRAEAYRKTAPPRDFIMLAREFGLADGYTHGVKNSRGNKGSLFSFAGSSMKHNPRTEAVLRYVVPHLHQSFARSLKQPDIELLASVSSREKEVLRWVKEGKSNFDIGMILGISENTIKYHVKSIMQKLNTRTRPQSVAVALDLGLIDIE